MAAPGYNPPVAIQIALAGNAAEMVKHDQPPPQEGVSSYVPSCLQRAAMTEAQDDGRNGSNRIGDDIGLAG